MSLFQPELDNILLAHYLQGIPPSEILVPYPSIRSLLDSQVRRYGDKPFLIYYSASGKRIQYTFNEFFRLVSKAANFLESSGSLFRDRIAIDTSNYTETVILLFAIWMIGAVVIQFAGNQNDDIIRHIVNHSKAKFAIVCSKHLPVLENLRDELPHLKTAIEIDRDFLSKRLKNQRDDFQIRQKSKISDEVFIVYNTDDINPKGIVLSHYNLLIDAMATGDWHKITDNQLIMCGVNLADIQGIIGSVMTALYSGNTLILNERFNKDSFFDRIQTEEVQIVIMNTTNLESLIKAKNSNCDLFNFRHIICGEVLSSDLIKTFRDKWGIKIIPGYGLPEATCYSSFLPIHLSDMNYQHWIFDQDVPSIGCPILPNEMDIQDTEGNSLPEGQKGEIVIRGHNVMKSYLNDDKATQDIFKHGWLRTGDKGYSLIGENGNRYFFNIS